MIWSDGENGVSARTSPRGGWPYSTSYIPNLVNWDLSSHAHPPIGREAENCLAHRVLGRRVRSRGGLGGGRIVWRCSEHSQPSSMVGQATCWWLTSNHQLRGGESEADEQFVSTLARELGLQFECDRLEAATIKTCSDGIEQAARSQRYLFLTNAAEKFGARYVACAHTADDQIETILHRMIRGTGIAGLAGIPRSRLLSPAVTLIRPLLEVRRTELVDYLALLGQPYREDSSNQDRRFTRNRIRHDLLPHLAEHYNPAVGEALRRLARLAGESQSVIRELVQTMMDDDAVSCGRRRDTRSPSQDPGAT